jgi:hypothetical protein
MESLSGVEGGDQTGHSKSLVPVPQRADTEANSSVRVSSKPPRTRKPKQG